MSGGMMVANESAGSTRSAAAQVGAAQVGAVSVASPAPNSSEALILEAFITARVDDVQVTADAIGERVREVGGRIVQERGTGADKGWHTFMRVRLPPNQVDSVLAWLGKEGTIETKRVQVEDVSKQLFDQKLAEENLRATLTRLQALLERSDLDVEAVLKIEAEMTRVRGQIEALQGSQRFLRNRVAFATIDFTLRRKDRVEHGPSTKFLAGVRAANMTLVDAGGRSKNRAGFGVSLQSPFVRVSYELDVYEADEGGKRPFVVSAGGSTYSDHLGGGTRTFLNPYLGMRVGYGRLDGSNFVLTGEAGLELIKHDYATLDLSVRGSSFFGKGGPDVAVVSSVGLSAAF